MAFDALICVPLTVCAANEFEVAAPSEFSDRECTLATECNFVTEFESSPLTMTSDRECSLLTVCGLETEYQTLPASATTDRECAPLTVCNAQSEYEAMSATFSSDRACSLLTTCSDNEFTSVPATTTSDRQCAPITTCVPGESEIRPPTEFLDRICEPCSPGTIDDDADPSTPCVACPKGSYQNEAGQTMCRDGRFVCPSGTYERIPASESSERVCEACNGVTEYQDLAGQSACKNVTACLPGTRQVSGSTSVSNTQCAPCDGVTEYQDEVGALTCKPITTACLPGTYAILPATPTNDRVCEPCPMDSFSSTLNAESCTQLTVCEPGSFVAAAGSNLQNRVCLPCQEGLTYSATANSETCTSVTQACGAGEFVAAEPTVSSDRMCEAVVQCLNETYRISNTECEDCAVCSELEYVRVPCTETSNTVCGTCSQCGFNEYVAAPCTLVSDTQCAPISPPCTSLEFEALPPTAVSDRVCMQVSQCNPEERQVINTPATATRDVTCRTCLDTEYPVGNLTCAACDVCRGDEFESAPCEVGNRVCSVCTICDLQTHFEAAACSATSDAVCTRCSVCASGEYASSPCNATADTVCLPVSVCPSGTFISQVATATSDVVCSPITVCDTNAREITVAPATPLSDTVCKVCDEGTYPNAGNACLPCASCPAGSFVSVACSVKNTVCEVCEDCNLDTHFMVSECTATANAVCVARTPCVGGFVPEVLPDQDDVCIEYTECEFLDDDGNQIAFEAVAPTSSTDRVCRAVTQCPTGQSVETPATTTSDAMCAAIQSGSGNAIGSTGGMIFLGLFVGLFILALLLFLICYCRKFSRVATYQMDEPIPKEVAATTDFWKREEFLVEMAPAYKRVPRSARAFDAPHHHDSINNTRLMFHDGQSTYPPSMVDAVSRISGPAMYQMNHDEDEDAGSSSHNETLNESRHVMDTSPNLVMMIRKQDHTGRNWLQTHQPNGSANNSKTNLLDGANASMSARDGTPRSASPMIQGGMYDTLRGMPESRELPGPRLDHRRISEVFDRRESAVPMMTVGPISEEGPSDANPPPPAFTETSLALSMLAPEEDTSL